MAARELIPNISNSLALSEKPGQKANEHDCTIWLKSSQAAHNMYMKGVKLWTKADLVDIEQQLSQSKERNRFTVRLIDGTVLATSNPMFNEEFPIW